jgi:D-alanyl-D-alanine dipeptidase
MTSVSHSSSFAGSAPRAGGVAARRRYWTEQMEAAHGYLQRLEQYPLTECGEPLLALVPAAREAGVRIEFPAGLKLGQLQRTFALRVSLVPRLLAAAEEMQRHGWLLRVEDVYRSLAVQAQGTVCDFIVETVFRRTRWELGGRLPAPELVLRRIRVLTATTAKAANHVAGSAVDITVLHTANGHDVDRGGPYLEISERTPMASPFLSPVARRNRDRIAELMAGQGFLPYPYEFWHFSHGDADYELISAAGRPARFGPVELDPRSGRVTAVADPAAALLDEGEVRRKLERLLGSARPREYPQ